MKILIVHLRRTGYGAVRALRGLGHEIYGADTEKTDAAFSRHLSGFFLLPDITETAPEEFCAALISIAGSLGDQSERPVLFTGKDDYVQFFAEHYRVLQPHFLLASETDPRVLRNAVDKIELARLAESCGVAVPRFVTSLGQSAGSFPLDFPVIIKPAVKNRPTIDVVSRAFRLRVCTDLHQLREAARLLDELGQTYLIQEYIPGPSTSLCTIGTYSLAGRLVAWSTGRKLREFPPEAGECALGTTDYIPELVEPARRMLSAIGLTGISQIEFKRFEDTYYLIEINPRLWSWHEVHRHVGVNFCRICLDQMVGQLDGGRVVSPEKKAILWHFVLMDFLHNYLLQRNISLTRLIHDLLASRVEAFLSLSDPVPFLVHLRRTAGYIRQQTAARRAATLL